jgi:cytochrome c biogenesis protein
LASNEQTQQFMTQMVLALSDARYYPAPMVLQLTDFTQVQASVFQVVRSPGKNIVYLGCFFLIVGIFAMLYIRERRLWIWLAPHEEGGKAKATLALSSNRKTMDGDREFGQLKSRLLGIKEE